MTKISAKNVVETWLGLLGAGDIKAVTEMFADDAVIDMPGTRKLPWAGRWQGQAKIEEYFRVMPAALEIREHEHRVWVAEENMVVVTGLEAAASRVSGKAYQSKWCWVFEVSDDKIAVWDAYEDTEAMSDCGPWY